MGEPFYAKGRPSMKMQSSGVGTIHYLMNPINWSSEKRCFEKIWPIEMRKGHLSKRWEQSPNGLLALINTKWCVKDIAMSRLIYSVNLRLIDDLFKKIDRITLKRVNWTNELNEIADFFKNRPDHPKKGKLDKWNCWFIQKSTRSP